LALGMNAATVAISPVGRHVDIQRQSAWVEAVQAYKAAEAVSVDGDTDDSVIDAAWTAFSAMFNTRAPSLRALHEKMALISQAEGWPTKGVINAVFADVEHLARRYEIAQPPMGDVTVSAGRAHWDDLMAR